jgi:hypothetical protein
MGAGDRRGAYSIVGAGNPMAESAVEDCQVTDVGTAHISRYRGILHRARAGAMMSSNGRPGFSALLE